MHLPGSSGSPLPERFLARLAIFADLFTCPTWANALVLFSGVILAPGRRTVTTALRILGRDRNPDFCTFHRILNRATWSSRAAASRLLLLLVNTFVPAGAPVVLCQEGGKAPCCTRDEGGPFGAALQEEAPNCHELLRSKAAVVNVMVKRRGKDCVMYG
jgi:hypothetical protein